MICYDIQCVIVLIVVYIIADSSILYYDDDVLLASRLCIRRALVGAKCSTPDLTNMNIRWKMPLKSHWAIPVTIHRVSDNPFEHTTEQ